MISKLFRHFKTDLLFQNSVYLMASAIALAGFGFFFWLIAARSFSPDDIGLATTLISSMSLLSFVSLVGFDNVFIRYLPKYKNKNDQINTGILMVALVSAILASLFVLLLPYFAPRLGVLLHGFWPDVLFVFFCTIASVNVLTDAYFMAQRSGRYILIVNTIFSIIKVSILFIPFTESALGIFIVAGIAQTIGAILSFLIMMWKFEYVPRFVISKAVIRDVRKYSSVVYVSSLLYLLPPTLLPIIITNRLGPASAAYFYIVFMIANLLYTVSIATARSLMAEGSHDEESLVQHTNRAFLVTMALLLPAILILLVFGKHILGIFGDDYANGGYNLLRLMAVSGIFLSVYGIGGSIFRVKDNLVTMLVANAVNAVSILALSFVLIRDGLDGIGMAWLLGQLISMLVTIYFAYRIESPLYESIKHAGKKLLP